MKRAFRVLLLGLLLAIPLHASALAEYFGGGLTLTTCGPGLYVSQFEVNNARYIDSLRVEAGLGIVPAGTELGVYAAPTVAGPYSLLVGTDVPNANGTIYPIDINMEVGWVLFVWNAPGSFDCVIDDGSPSTSYTSLSWGTMLNGGMMPFEAGGLPATLDPVGAGALVGEFYGGTVVTQVPEYPPVVVLAAGFPLTLYEDGGGIVRSVVIDGSASYDPDGTITTWIVQCGGQTAPGSPTQCNNQSICTCEYLNDDSARTGSFYVADNQALSDSESFYVEILNLPPTAAPVCDNGTCTGNEGDSLSFTCTATDPGWNDVPTIDWNFDGVVVQGPRVGGGIFGNGLPFTTANTYADDGSFLATCAVADDDGGSDSVGLSVTINNVAPSITSFSGPGNASEGGAISYSVAFTDPGVNDVLTANWDFGDGTSAVGSNPGHSFVDEGSYTVMVTVDDGDGGTATQSLTTSVSNVAPSLTGTCPTAVTEGGAADFVVDATDPGTSDVLTFGLSGTATGASIGTGGGATTVLWTPSYTDAQAGSVTLTVSVNDGDGGSDALPCTISVAYLDADADGMPDTWEVANSLNPSVDDSAGDPDGDGISNYDEWLAGSNPQAFGGPTSPVPSSPVAGAEVTSLTPSLTWANATDPNGDPITYTFEIYGDASLSSFVTGASGIAETAGGTTSAAPTVSLVENTGYWWRVRASDGVTDSDWSTARAFFVNVANDPPGQPVASYPTSGQLVSALTPTLQWSAVTDADEDALTHEVEVYGDAGLAGLVWTGAGAPVGGSVEALSGTLVENGAYWWRARAVDEHGLAGGWSATESFLVSLVDDAPSAPSFVTPNNGGQVADLSPVLEAGGALDPEGAAVSLEIELALDAAFAGTVWSSGLLADSGAGVQWDSDVAGALLTEDAPAWARARALDAGGLMSPWTTITFGANSANDAPSVPVLIAPDDGTMVALGTALELRWANASDPDGTLRTYDVEVADGGGVVWSELDVAETDTETGVTVPGDELEPASYTWTVRAVDELGAESDWADAFQFEVLDEGDDDDATSDDDDATGDDDDATGDDDDATGDDDDDDDDAADDDDSGTGGGGCDCSSDLSGGSGAGWLGLLLLGGVLRRVRRVRRVRPYPNHESTVRALR